MIKLDPRVKIMIVAYISTLVILAVTTYQLLLIFIINLLLGLILKVNYMTFMRRARYLLIVVISITIFQSVFNRGGNPLIIINGFALITDYGLDMGLQFILRMSIIISSALIVATSNSREITDGLIRMKLPYELAFMMNIAIRFLPEFKQDFSNRLIAISLRGVDIGKLAIVKKIKVYTYLITPAVTGAVLRSQMLAVSMETRGFRAMKSRTMLRELRLRAIDYISILIITLAFGLAVYLIYRG